MKFRAKDDYWLCWKCKGYHLFTTKRCPVYPS